MNFYLLFKWSILYQIRSKALFKKYVGEASCNILNGIGCKRNKMCFNLSEVFEPARTRSFARVRA